MNSERSLKPFYRIDKSAVTIIIDGEKKIIVQQVKMDALLAVRDS